MNLTLVTGNEHKLREWQRLMPPEFNLVSHSVDLVEIQPEDITDPTELARDKAMRAFAILGTPVVVEDVSAGLEAHSRLPGPFIKYYEKLMGPDALYQLAAGLEDKRAYAAVTVAYYDGKNEIIVTAETLGSVVASRGKDSFGFDCVFVPDGETKTYGEMTPEEKDKVSHRAKAIGLFIEALKSQQ